TDQGRRGRRPGAVRAVLPGHAAPGGGHAAVRQRAEQLADTVRRRVRPGGDVRKGGRLRGPRRPHRGRRARRAEPAPRAGRPGRRGRRVPRSGYPVVRGDEVIGEVTSGAPSPTLGKPIAMAYVDPAHAGPGTAGVAVDIRGRQEPYEVVALPFYKRQK